MFTQAQIEYIQKQFARGLNKDAIRNKLMDAGWEISDIEDGFREFEKSAPKTDAQITSEINKTEQPSTAAAATPSSAQIVETAIPTQGLQPQIQPQVEVVKTMPGVMPVASSNSNGGKIFMIILAIVVVLAAGAFVFYKFIYLPKMGAIDTNVASSTVVTLPESNTIPSSPTTTEETSALPQVEGEAPSDVPTTTEEQSVVDETQPTGSENVDNAVPPIGM